MNASVLPTSRVENSRHFAPKSGYGGSLGNTANKGNPTTSKKGKKRFKKSKYGALGAADYVLVDDEHEWRTCHCMKSLADGRGGVSVNYVAASKSSHFGNLQTCGSVWVCPVCSVKISARRAEQVKAIVKQSGFTPVLLTYTLQHNREDELKTLLNDLKSALKYQRQGSARKRFNERFNVGGYVRSVEIRYGRNGWHPHAHELLLLDMPSADVNTAEIKAQVMGRYGKWLSEHGYKVNSHTVDVRLSAENPANTVDEYLTKSAIELELTQGQIKEGKSLSPFQILAQFEATGDIQYAELYREYANATFNKRQMTFSRGLLAAYGIEEKTDEELATEREKEAIVLAVLMPSEWRRVVVKRLRAELLIVAETGSLEAVWDWLRDNVIRDRECGVGAHDMCLCCFTSDTLYDSLNT